MHIDEDAVTSSNADATGGEPIFKDGTGIGRVTSGAYGYSVGMSLALGFVSDAAPGDRVDVMILGQPHGATILDAPPFDPLARGCAHRQTRIAEAKTFAT